jgi:hypothetical protein
MNSMPPVRAAFPTENQYFYRPRSGMSMREYYLGKALQGLMANPEFFKYLQDDELHRQRLLLPALAWADSCVAITEEE